jgi:type IV pilus assembly protein PilW
MDNGLKSIMMIDNKGFSLIELMVAVGLIAIVAAGLITSFTGQQESSISQKQVVEMQQHIRASIYIMNQEIRMAGYDPHGGLYDAEITNAGDGTTSAKALTFTYVADDDGSDNDGDSTIDEEGELKTISFYLYDAYDDGDDDLGMKVGNANVQVIAENIVNNLDQADPVYDPADAEYVPTFYFTYLDTNGDSTTDIDDIAAVRINVVAKVGDETTDYTTQNATRTVTTIVQCRNLDL